MAEVISIIRWVCHDLLLLGLLVSSDESSASLSVVPNYRDGTGDKRWKEDWERWGASK